MAAKFSIVPDAVWSDRRLKIADLRVLGALFSFRRGSDDWEVWPSRDAIAERAGGMHPSTVSRITARLVRFGWIEIRDARGANRVTLRDTPVIRPPEAPQPSPPEATVSTTPPTTQAQPSLPEATASPRYRRRRLALATGGDTEEINGRDQLNRERKKVDGGVGEGGTKSSADSPAAPKPQTDTPAPVPPTSAGRARAIAIMREMTDTTEPRTQPRRKLQPIAPSGTLAPVGDIARVLLRKARP
jgi:hypothetical protein